MGKFVSGKKVITESLHSLRHSPQNNTRYSINSLGSLPGHRSFNSRRKTVLYCHGKCDNFIVSTEPFNNCLNLGWVDDFNSEGTQQVTRAYIHRNDHNIIVLDWGWFSFTNLENAVKRSSVISKHVGKALLKLFQLGVDVSTFHCVGHSIGAQMCGMMGRELIAISSGRFKLKR